MPWGMQTATTEDIIEIVKYDATAGRLFKIDRHLNGDKTPTDITNPPPTFAIDFGTLEIGYISFSGARPDFRLVPEGKPLPVQPLDRAEPANGKPGQLLFRPGFRVRLYGKVLDGLREFASAAAIVNGAVEDLYSIFREAPEAATGKIPIIRLTATVPITSGRPPNQKIYYVPRFVITAWTDRVPAMGERTVPAPRAAAPPPPPKAPDLDDEIPF